MTKVHSMQEDEKSRKRNEARGEQGSVWGGGESGQAYKVGWSGQPSLRGDHGAKGPPSRVLWAEDRTRRYEAACVAKDQPGLPGKEAESVGGRWGPARQTLGAHRHR